MPNGPGQSSIAKLNDSLVGKLRIVTSDARADGRRRCVDVDRMQVKIDRTLSGMRMNIVVPSKAYRGVALSIASACDGQEIASLQLVHRDPDLNVPLSQAQRSDELIAQWTSWADFFQLPRLLENEKGALETVDVKLGAIRLGDSQTSRRLTKTVGQRRPRFLARRRVGTATIGK